LLLFWLIVCLPVVVIVGVGWRLAKSERDTAQQRVRDLLLVRLQDTAQVLDGYFQDHARRLQALTEAISDDPVSIRRLFRRDPHISQMFLLDAEGKLQYPNPRTDLNLAERRFLSDAGDLFARDDLMRSLADDDEKGTISTSGWVVRFWGPGLNLIYCQRLASGQLVGVVMRRARWIADLIAALPDTNDARVPDGRDSWNARIRLVDSVGRPVYEWGSFEPDEHAAPLQELPPSYPLSSWRLQHFIDNQTFAVAGRSAYFNLMSVLGATGLALVMAAALFYREYNRQVRDARQRVSFVNQVSHELKTPLTNIRMYAELLEDDLGGSDHEQDIASRKHLKVIVEESQRLSRLIGNVLTLAEKQRDRITLRFKTAVVDDVIATVVQRFEPALRRRGVEVVFEGSAKHMVALDVDAFEQILGNLLSNVEKYASSGKRLEITSVQSNSDTTIVISDDGPGIPSRQQQRIFRPFERLSNHIADSPGTGIGLTIARELARLHGGDLRLLPSKTGSRFEIRIHTPSDESEASA
jgi:signal transduction histidine kinase